MGSIAGILSSSSKFILLVSSKTQTCRDYAILSGPGEVGSGCQPIQVCLCAYTRDGVLESKGDIVIKWYL